MKDSAFTIFIIFGIIWFTMGIVGVIALFKADGKEIKVGKIGLVVAIPIILPIVLTLAYAAFRGTF